MNPFFDAIEGILENPRRSLLRFASVRKIFGCNDADAHIKYNDDYLQYVVSLYVLKSEIYIILAYGSECGLTMMRESVKL